MLTLLHKVFFKELLHSIVAVLLGFLMLFMTIDAITELRRVGTEDYTVKTLLQVVLLKLPEYVYQLLPICALIGSVLALSNMAARSELVVWRVSGLSLWRLVGMVCSLGAVLAVALWLLGDVGIAKAQQYSKDITDKALHRTNFFRDDGGFWSKQNLAADGSRMINVKNIRDGKVLENISIYELTADFTLSRMIEAKSAVEQGKAGLWLLRDVRSVQLQPDALGLAVTTQETKIPEFSIDLAENSLTVMRNYGSDSTNLSVAQLRERIETFEATGQSSREYQVTYWQKIFYPIGTIIMMLLALPFAFMQTRKGGVGVRVFTGIMLGLLFFVLTAMAQYLGGLVQISPIVLAGAPIVLFLIIAMVWIRRITHV